jgi:hypothetical protein
MPAMRPQVFDLEIDEWNERECGQHGVTPLELFQVLDEAPLFFPNKRRHRATLLMIGPTGGGRCLTVPIAPTDRAGVWRPATAWRSTVAELAKYRANSRR